MAPAVAVVALMASACSTSTSGTSRSPGAGRTTVRGSGPVSVMYAGSLVNLMENQVAPPFDAATGYTFTGYSGGSAAVATQIRSRVRQGDVFVSASPSVDADLEGSANGNWVSWYATFATSPLVLGYSPSSRFADDLKSRPWYRVLTEPGLLIGRTDPATDPKGKLTATALRNAASADDAPGLTAVAASTSNVFPENTLVGRLQASQLDAGFLYSSEAKAANIPTVGLTGQNLMASYTITVLNDAPHEGAGEAFVAFLLGPSGRSILTRDGFSLVTPATVAGIGVPAGLRSVLTS